MSSFFKKIIRSNYHVWLIFALYRRVCGTLKAVHSGISKNNKSQNNLFNFRRDIHRLEKGLLYKKRKPFFANNYIELTIDRLDKCTQSNVLDKETSCWAVAVLNKYFSSVEHNTNIEKAFKKFTALDLKNVEPDYVPYKSIKRDETKIEYESLLDLSKRRRSVRYFLDKRVNPELVKKAARILLQSPSACNRQSFGLFVYGETEQVKKITALPGGVKGYEVPNVVVVTAKYEGYFEERDLFTPYIDSSLGVMSFLLALETLGLSSVVINWSQNSKNNQEIRKIVPLDDDEVVVMLIGVGYPDPDGLIPYSSKRDVDEVISFDRYIPGKTFSSDE